MNYLHFSIQTFLIYVGYLIISILSKIVIFIPLSNALQGGISSAYFALTVSVFIAGLVAGFACSRIINSVPLYGALVIAIVATAHRLWSPEITPLPMPWYLVLPIASFISIMLGSYATKRNA
jgi:hypothetical protein